MPEWTEVALRTLAAVCVLFVMTKVLGKRQISQLSLFEYITGITIGNLAANVSVQVDSTWYLGVVALSVWVAVSVLFEFLTMKSKKVRDIVDGKATVLIQDGKVLEDNVKSMRLTIDELMEQLRKKSAFKLADVEFAVMESSGEINVMLVNEARPLTPRHLGIKVAPKTAPRTVIMDGRLMDSSLVELGLSRQWLQTELEKQGVLLDNVFVGQVDGYGQLFIDLYNDELQLPQPQNKEVLQATLKKCQADLTLFGLTTENEKARTMYETAAAQMEQVLEDIKHLLQG
ncbi:DUF421 domain-containing protein [Paenibacillus sp. y28]|uniref:DUF421 domain-containing protein n=1 Tax=Paenibacillus sp. y28 TaxID=3129110 RepID=UPI0030199640